MRLESLNWSFADRDSEPSSIAPADVVRLPDTVTTKSSFLHDFRDSPPDLKHMDSAVLHIRLFAAGVLCATALSHVSVAQAQVADDPQVDDLAKRCCVFRLHLDETSVLVIDLPWARSRKATEVRVVLNWFEELKRLSPTD